MNERTMINYIRAICAVLVAIAAVAGIVACFAMHRETIRLEREADEAHRMRVTLEQARKVTKASPNYGLARLCVAIGTVYLRGAAGGAK